MARSIVQRIIAAFDRPSARKAEQEMAESMGRAGAEGGKRAGQGFLRDLRREFDKRKADLQVALARGTISEKEFRKQTALAEKTFREGILRLMDEAKKKGKEGEAEYIKLSRALKRVGDEGQRHIGERLVGALKKAAIAAAALFGIRQIVRFGRESVRAFEALRTGQRQLEQQLRNTGIAWEDVRGEVRQTARALWDTHRLTEGEVQGTLRQLILVTGDYQKSLQLVGLAHDLMAATGLGAEQATRLLGRAMNGELGALNRYGIQLEANRDVVEQLTERLHGQARAATSNAITWQKAIGDLKETIGGLITAAFGMDEGFSAAAEAVRKLNDAISEHGDEWGRVGRLTVATVKIVGNSIWVLAQGLGAGLSAIIGSVLAALNTIPATVDFIIAQLNRLPGIDIDVTLGRLPASRFLDEMRESNERVRQGVEGIAKAWRDVSKEAEKADRPPPRVPTGAGAGGDGRADPAAQAFADRSAQINQEIADLRRLQDAHRESARAVEDLQRALQVESAERQATAGLREHDKAQIAELIRLREAERDALAELEQAAARGEHVAAMERDIEVLRRRAEAVRQGEDAVNALNRELAIEEAELRSGAEAGSEYAAQIRDLAAAHFDAAQQVESAWADALQTIDEEAQAVNLSIASLFQAWASGGIGSVARLAKAKVVENLAWAAENFAKAMGWVALGNVPSAAAARQAAGQHLAAAAKWGAAGAVAGAASGGAGAGPTLSGPRQGVADSAERPGSEVHIYFQGPGFNAVNPEVQRVVHQAGEFARERFGENARVHTHRTGS